MADQSIPSDDQLPQKYTPNFTYFQGFWCRSELVPNITCFQNHFQALDADIVLASKPKTGTTWLKALAFSILNRHRFPLSNSPLASSNPHDLVPYFEMTLYNNGCHPDFADVSSPRLFATHLSYHALAESIKNSKARIVYVTRNPPDVIVSMWHFATSRPERAHWPIDECFEQFCRGEEGVPDLSGTMFLITGNNQRQTKQGLVPQIRRNERKPSGSNKKDGGVHGMSVLRGGRESGCH
ncbi:hypothetical protein ES332_D10G239900v1 [Gossypium tomentosum]|uniref:Sulfotransferase n=1 Tax=Gossypium tomentosum TaxID=34277 RepID=A0A5D2J9B5_GOSTO|nr:hypothetical protein ES332_D10G239900v1 [Gossypium tomentosum]